MRIIKQHSHKQGKELINKHYPDLLLEIENAVESIQAVSCLTKVSKETSRIRQWGGLVFSPPTINSKLAAILYPLGWATWDKRQNKYVQPRIRFEDDSTIRGVNRYRKMDGLKNRVGLEIQLGKYAFMGYDIFSKMIIFRNQGLIDYGIEIVLVQAMVNRMSTGVSAFEHIMIDFRHRGEADIDIPVLVLGIGPTAQEWEEADRLQQLFRDDPEEAQRQYPEIGKKDLKGNKPGPK